MTVFEEQGIAETSVLQVTQAAGVSNGTFYRYFDDKEQLEYAIGGIVLAELGRTLEEMQRDQSGAERIAIGAFGVMRTVGANHEVGSILAEYFERRNALLQEAAVQLADHIREGAESGEFPWTPRLGALSECSSQCSESGRARSWPGRTRTTSVSSSPPDNCDCSASRGGVRPRSRRRCAGAWVHGSRRP